MNKLGSEFLKPLSSFKSGGMNFRMFLMIIGLSLGVGLSVVISLLGLPDILMYLSLIIICPPFVLYGLEKETIVKDILKFKFTIQERSYMTEFESEDLNDLKFTQEKGVNEWNEQDTFE